MLERDNFSETCKIIIKNKVNAKNNDDVCDVIYLGHTFLFFGYWTWIHVNVLPKPVGSETVTNDSTLLFLNLVEYVIKFMH